MQQMKLKADLAQKRMDYEFQLQMARLGHFQTQPGARPSSMAVLYTPSSSLSGLHLDTRTS